MQIYHISKAVVELDAALGGAADVVWMCCREPEILNLSSKDVLRRLLDMKLSTSGDVTNIVHLIEQQPRLLFDSETTIDRSETPRDQIPAWEHGLLSDSDVQWRQRFAEMQRFYAQHGHSHIGWVPRHDDPELAAWAAKQRRDFDHGVLSSDRQRQLESIEFVFDAIEAEWLRWFHEWRIATNASPSSTDALYLTHWCSVQRIAQRTGRLSVERKRLLDAYAFDWNIPDPLS